MRFAPIFLGLLAVICVSGQVSKEQYINDLNVLNYALALENFESALYSAFLAKFTNAADAGVSTKFYDYLKQSGAAESAHASALKSVLEGQKWPAAPACNFTSYLNALTDAPNWLETIRVVENVGAGAYTYASQYLTNAGFLQFAGTVATVEARHASFLNTAVGQGANQNPFPLATETGLPVATVLDANHAGPAFTSCGRSLPVVCFDGVTRNVSVFDHVPGGPNEPKLANTFRKTPSGTFPVLASPENVVAPKLSQAAYARDTLVLQYALTAENAENAFYNLTLTNVTKDAFVTYFDGSVSPFSGATQPTAGDVYDYLVLIGQHEAGHVVTLNTVISGRSTSGVPACTYPGNFSALGFDGTPLGLLKSAQAFENTGVGAYLGALTLLSDVGLVQAAASIALIEARHAAYLQVLVKAAGLLPNSDLTAVGQSYDAPIFPKTVVDTLGPLLGTCPNIATPDTNNTPSTYNSGTIPGITTTLNDLAAAGTKNGGYNDAAAYAAASSSATNSNTNTSPAGSSVRTTTSGSASVVATFALIGAAMLF